MRACGAGVEIGTKVQLRAEEEDRQENGNDANSRPFIRHVYIQEELKEEWLPGQGSWGFGGVHLRRSFGNVGGKVRV